MAAHADADDRDLGDAVVAQHILVADGLAGAFDDLDRVIEVGLGDGKGEVRGFVLFRDVLHDHVDVDAGLGQGAENGGGDAGAVGHPAQRNFGFVAGIGDATDDLLFHDLILIYDQGSGGGAEARQDLYPHAVVHGHDDGAGLQDLGALRGHFEHFLVGDLVQLAGLGDDARVGREDAVHVGIDVAAIGPQRRRQGHRGGVGAAPADGGQAVVRCQALIAGHHRHLALGHAGADLGRLDIEYAGAAVHVVGAHRQLPGQP